MTWRMAINWYWIGKEKHIEERYSVNPIIHRSLICEFAYSLKFICNPKSICTALWQLLTEMHRAAKNVSHPVCIFPAVSVQGDSLPSYFSSHTVSKCSFCGVFNALFFFLHLIWLFQVAPKCSANLLASVQHKRSVMYIIEKLRVLDGLRSDISYSDVGCGFNVNELTIYIE